MDKKDRVLTTLDIEEPDRLPFMEMDIEMPLLEKITGEKFSGGTSFQTPVISDRELEEKRVDLKIDAYRKLDFDMFVASLSAPEEWELLERDDQTIVGPWGRVLKLDRGRNQWVPYSTVFEKPEDFYEFEFPEPEDQGWMLATEHAKERIQDDMAIASFIRDPFAHAWEMFTPSKFVRWLYQKTDFIEDVIDRLTEHNVKLIDNLADAGADLIISGGDYCEEKGPMVPNKYFEQIVFPNLEEQVKEANKNGLKFVKHTDGNVTPLLDDLSRIVDGVHSLDPSAGVDIGKVKEEYGQDLILFGNVSVDNLANNSREEVVEETKNCIKRASPGGGHVLSSSNSWAAGAKLENCLAMIETAKEYGSYPIEL